MSTFVAAVVALFALVAALVFVIAVLEGISRRAVDSEGGAE